MEEHRGLGVGVTQRDACEVLAEGEEPCRGEGEEDGVHARGAGNGSSIVTLGPVHVKCARLMDSLGRTKEIAVTRSGEHGGTPSDSPTTRDRPSSPR